MKTYIIFFILAYLCSCVISCKVRHEFRVPAIENANAAIQKIHGSMKNVGEVMNKGFNEIGDRLKYFSIDVYKIAERGVEILKNETAAMRQDVKSIGKELVNTAANFSQGLLLRVDEVKDVFIKDLAPQVNYVLGNASSFIDNGNAILERWQVINEIGICALCLSIFYACQYLRFLIRNELNDVFLSSGYYLLGLAGLFFLYLLLQGLLRVNHINVTGKRIEEEKSRKLSVYIAVLIASIVLLQFVRKFFATTKNVDVQPQHLDANDNAPMIKKENAEEDD